MDNEITQTTRLLTLGFEGQNQRVIVKNGGYIWWCYHDVYHILNLRNVWGTINKIPKRYVRRFKVGIKHGKGISNVDMIFVDWTGLKMVIKNIPDLVRRAKYSKWVESMIFDGISDIIRYTDRELRKKELGKVVFDGGGDINQKEAAGDIKIGDEKSLIPKDRIPGIKKRMKEILGEKSKKEETVNQKSKTERGEAVGRELIPFQFRGMDQRTLKIDGKELWCVNDACLILGLKNPSNLLKRIPKAHLYRIEVDITDKNGWKSKRSMLFVDEAGLNYLIMRSDKPIAIPYQEWNLSVVLPTLRKTGTYTIPGREMIIRRYTSDQIDHMNNQVGIMLASLEILTPIVIENKMQLNDVL